MGEINAKAAKEYKIYGYEPDPERCQKRAGEIVILPASLDEAVRLIQIRRQSKGFLQFGFELY